MSGGGACSRGDVEKTAKEGGNGGTARLSLLFSLEGRVEGWPIGRGGMGAGDAIAAVAGVLARGGGGGGEEGVERAVAGRCGGEALAAERAVLVGTIVDFGEG